MRTRLTALLAATGLAAIATSVLVAGPAPALAPQSPSGGDLKAYNVCADTPVDFKLIGARAGELIADPQDVTAESGLSSGRLYRIVYATASPRGGVEASCGLVAVPASGAARGVVAWAHGTVGLTTDCQPSQKPANFVGAMPGGIGSPTKKGAQSSGALAGMLAAGFVVVATDYYSGLGMEPRLQHYALGVSEGIAVLDSARAFTAAAPRFGMPAIGATAELPLVTWGHSQGGGSALWAGQLAKAYLAAKADRSLDLAGVAAEAPATQFTTSAGQPAAWNGAHLGDRDMYNFNPGLGVKLPIGPVLFSYVTANWSQLSGANRGSFPVGPTASVDYTDVLTPAGSKTAPNVSQKCLDVTSQKIGIVSSVEKYLYPKIDRFFASPFGGTNASGTWTGAIDATCADPASAAKAVRDWCSWLTYNMPGPYGTSDYSPVPLNNDGEQVPVLLAQGTGDRIMWCVDGSGAVQPVNCLTAQFAKSLQAPYCNGGGSLETDYYAGESHFGIPGAVANNSAGTGYSGSPLQKFVTGAMKGTLQKVCTTNSM